jgi:AAA+ ATPase superfamily predicted ATPase
MAEYNNSICSHNSFDKIVVAAYDIRLFSHNFWRAIMAVEEVLGREKEKEVLKEVLDSKEAEFVAIYGRRRVGKTHLIRQFFSEKGVYLEASGAKDKPLKKQIENFMKAVSKTFFKDISLGTPLNWDAAFDILTKELKGLSKSKKIIVFLDELPWMATKRSGLLQSLDYYWNLHWSKLSNLVLIVCGSAASWMLEKLIYSKGGLHKRITRKMLLEPYKLKETEQFLKKRGFRMNQKQILDLYMAIGGIPFYLRGLRKGLSAAQNINALCFEKNGLLYDEFKNLFESLFDKADVNLTIVREIVKHGNKISREELIRATGISSGGTLNKRLKELEAAGFIQSFLPFERTKRGHFYRVNDEFSLFHLKWIEPFIEAKAVDHESAYWQNIVKTPAVSSWAGLAYEAICLKHIAQVRKALGLEKVTCKTGSWQFSPQKGSKEEGVQIDLLFDRQDGAVTICEIKYSEKPFVIDKTYAKKLMLKMDTFELRFKTTKQIILALVTTMGLKSSVWSKEIVDKEVILKDLFA